MDHSSVLLRIIIVIVVAVWQRLLVDDDSVAGLARGSHPLLAICAALIGMAAWLHRSR